MTHRIVIDGEPRDIDIRAMDEGFIVYRKMYVPPLTRASIGMILPHDDVRALQRAKRHGHQQVVEEFFRRQIRAIGSCMVLAWDGEGVVGKMHFTTREMYGAIRDAAIGVAGSFPPYYCVDSPRFPEAIVAISEEDEARLLASESRTLRIVCFNVGHADARWQGKGIAGAMIEYLAGWARERGWPRIEIGSCPDVTPYRSVGSWMLRRGPLERRGFRVAETVPTSPADAALRLRTIEEAVAGTLVPHPWEAWWVAHVPDILAAHPDWREEYDREYVMVWELCDHLSR